MKKLLLLAVLSILFFNACSEDDGPSVVSDLDERIQVLYQNLPDPDYCDAGMINAAQKDEALTRVNFLRQLCDLPEVVYDGSQDESLQAAALLMAVNNKLDHNPTAADECYSEEAAFGAHGNLWMGTASSYYEWAPSEMIDDLVNDLGVETLGHRLWLLNPFMKNTAFGRVDINTIINDKDYILTSSVVYVQNHSATGMTSNATTDFIAYPKNEMPSDVFSLDWYHSFSVLVDKTNIWKNTADYSGATILVEDASGTPMTVTSIDYMDPNPTTMNGFPNLIKWKVVGLQNDMQYKVTISNVKSSIGTKTYTYYFSVSDGA
jgi:hypothetical protein